MTSPPVGPSPEEGGALDEADQVPAPAGGLQPPTETSTPKEKTRRGLAYTLIAILAALVAVGCYGWILHGNETDRMQNFVLIFSPVVTLLGTVLGFYFSSSDK